MFQYYVIIFSFALLLGCNNSEKEAVDKSKCKTDDNLIPGMGEYMVQLDYHHQAMMTAIGDTNFKRVDFEIDEMDEVFEKIEHFHNQHKKLKQSFSASTQTFMLPVLNDLRRVVTRKNVDSCRIIFSKLSRNCNACHLANEVEFIKVK